MQSTATRLAAVGAGTVASFATGAALAQFGVVPALAGVLATLLDGTTFVLACVGPDGMLDTDPRLVLGQPGRTAHPDEGSTGCVTL